MSLIIYSQYTKPEGTIKFDDLVTNARSKGVKFLGMTDHGNFSGIAEFYTKCLDFGIKPIIGTDFFCRLENDKYFRISLLIKNYSGYKSVLDLVRKFRYDKKYCYCLVDDISVLHDCFICINLYKIDILSESVETEDDPEYILKRITVTGIDINDLYFVCNSEKESESNLISEKLSFMSSAGRIRLLGCNPVYYLNEGDHKLKEMASRFSGTKQIRHYRDQFLQNVENLNSIFDHKTVENVSEIAKSCHFILEEVPVKYPDLNIKWKIDYSSFETLKAETKLLFDDKSDVLKSLITEELAYIRKHNISSLILFMLEAKKEFYNIYARDIFFSGFISDLHLAYLFGLSLSTPVFTSNHYHRSVLANKKIHPQITVIVSPESRHKLFEYLAGKFPADRICFLSDYVKWHFTAIINTLTSEYGLSKELSEILLRNYKQNFRSTGQLEEILNSKEVKDLFEKYPDQKEILKVAVNFDDVFRNYNTNTNQIVISGEDVKTILPVTSRSDEMPLDVSFYNMSTARYFGVWNINIESNGYLDLRRHFELGPLVETSLNKISEKLTEKIISDDLAMIPYFSYSHMREKYLELSKDPFCNLIIYLESGRSNLSFLLNRQSPGAPGIRYKKELQITRGFIVFKEQFYYICDKLFSSKETLSLKRRLLESTSLIQFNSILNLLSENKNCTEKCEYIRAAVQPTVFYLSLSEIAAKTVIALRILELKEKYPDRFVKFIFEKEVRSGGEWRKYIKFLKDSGYKFIKISLLSLNKEAEIKDKNVILPLYCVKGISQKISDYLFDFINEYEPMSFQDFIEKCDKNLIRHNTIDILVKIGFFDIFNRNRKELSEMNDKYYKSIKKEDTLQNELFEISEIEISVDSATDFTVEEKKNFEDEFTGLVFTSSEAEICELCSFLKPGSGRVGHGIENIYENHHFILYASIESEDNSIVDGISKFISDKGNCSLELYFSDTKQALGLNGKIDLNELNLYKLKFLLKEVPFYIGIK